MPPSSPLQRLEVHTHCGSTHYLAAWMPDPHSPRSHTHRYMCAHTDTDTHTPRAPWLIIFLTPPSPQSLTPTSSQDKTRWVNETWSWFWVVPSQLDTVAEQLKLFDLTWLVHNGAGQMWALDSFSTVLTFIRGNRSKCDYSQLTVHCRVS